MKHILIAIVAALVVALGATAALASNGNGQQPPGGDNPCPPSYHAEGDQCVHNGDGGGNCGQNQSDNGGDHGYGNQEGCGEENPPPEPPPVTPPTPPVTPPSVCTFVGADKDGGVDAFGGTNDDCAPFPAPPVVTPATTPVCPVVTVTKTVTKVVPKIVYRVKTKVVYRTKIKVVTHTVVKVKKVYVPGLHANGAEGKG